MSETGRSGDGAIGFDPVVRIDSGTDRVTVAVRGDVDMLTAPALRARLLDVLSSPSCAPVVVVDLTDVEFLGSPGLAAMVEVLTVAREQGTALRVVAADRATMRPFDATGLAAMFDLYRDRSQALRAG